VNGARVSVEEWTDDEWLAVLRTVPLDADVAVGEMAVAEMRGRRPGAVSVVEDR
jgi:hypothetical protein